MKNFYGYVRVSTAKQGERGVSLQEQHDSILRYAQRNAFEITGWFEERVTAAKRGRPIFNEMLALLSRGKADGVIIHKIDRGARNLRDWADLVELFDKGIEVHCANENIDLHSRGGRLSADIQAVVAADYIRNLREETRKGFYGRIKQGVYPLPAPVGYLDRGKGMPKAPDPLKAGLVKRTFELYATGRYSLDSLIEEVNHMGLRNRRGGKLTRNGLSVMLNNPFYIGLIRLKRTGETFAGGHAPLIGKSLFDRVQGVLSGKIYARNERHGFLFRRLFQCAACGYSLIGEHQKGHTYYRCHTKRCPITSVRQDDIEEDVLTALRPLLFSDDEKASLKEQVAHLQEGWDQDQKTQTAAWTMRLGQIQDRLARLTDAYIDGGIEKEIFEERKTALLMERKEIEEQLSHPNVRLPDRVSQFLELAGDAYFLYEKGLPDEKRDLLQIVTSNRTVTGKSVELTLSEPFDAVAKRHESLYSGPYRDRPRTLDQLFADLWTWFKVNPAVSFESVMGLPANCTHGKPDHKGRRLAA